jgi:hypothetical protein
MRFMPVDTPRRRARFACTTTVMDVFADPPTQPRGRDVLGRADAQRRRARESEETYSQQSLGIARP